ncbi:cytochrome c-type biogenesis CcmF C-terminal domain-containing protein [Desulfothermus okinawensis JCM 13304]
MWLLFIAGCGVILVKQRGYKKLSVDTKAIFWSLFYATEAFFFLLLITVANPFLLNNPPPTQGNGLNPLLIHPGMIFHPPALFLGYASLVVPALIGLSIRICGFRGDVFYMIRKWTMFSWVFLSIGIILGMWWSYYELGWGGYWAWDPVENASLVPWLCTTGFLHVNIVATREKALERTWGLLLGLSLISCFVATFLTRSGIIQSLHAFSEGGIGGPILFLIIISLILVIYITCLFPSRNNNELSGMFSKNGFLIICTWMFLGLCAIILIGTMYPVISKALFSEAKGLSSSFYNRVFLPIGSFLIFLIIFCPWIKWRSESMQKQGFMFLGIFVFLSIIIWVFKIKNLLVLLSISSGICAFLSVIYFVFKYNLYSKSGPLGKWGIHLSIIIMAISIAISSGFKKSADFILAKGQSIKFENYEVRYKDFTKKNYQDKIVYTYNFDVNFKDKHLGELNPEKIFYLVQNNLFSKVAVLRRFFDELYLSVIQSTENGVLKLQIQRNPMVHWIWYGAILLTIMGSVATFKRT